MIPTSTILACVFTMAVCLVLPVGLLIACAVKNKKQGIVPAWLLGAAGFFVPQMLIRMPILNALAAMPGFAAFSQNHLFLYTLSLAFTAGLFELAGRFAAAKLLERKNLTWKRSLAAGLGHGGIEAMIIVGLTYINNIVIIAMINSGSYETLIAQTAALGADTSQLQMVRDALLTTPPALFLLASLERVLTMIAHAAMSVLVCWGVHVKKPWKGALLCLLMHTLIDTAAGISLLAPAGGGTVLSQNAAYAIIYAVLFAAAALSLLLLRQIRRRWLAEERKGNL